jgi:hypothetical protein
LLVVAVNVEILLKGLVNTFRLTVTFRVVTGGKVELHVKSFSERLDKVGDELRTSIGSDVTGNSMLRIKKR